MVSDTARRHVLLRAEELKTLQKTATVRICEGTPHCSNSTVQIRTLGARRRELEER
jgi:hypothetical protein